MTAPTDHAIALHEAAHAIRVIELGGSFDHVKLRDHTGSAEVYGLVLDRPLHRALVAVAGPVLTAMLEHRPAIDVLNSRPCRADKRVAMDGLHRAKGHPGLTNLLKDTATAIRQMQVPIRAVAQALLKSPTRRLSFDQVLKVLKDTRMTRYNTYVVDLARSMPPMWREDYKLSLAYDMLSKGRASEPRQLAYDSPSPPIRSRIFPALSRRSSSTSTIPMCRTTTNCAWHRR